MIALPRWGWGRETGEGDALVVSVGVAIEVEVELEQVFAMDGFGPGVLKADFVEEIQRRVFFKGRVQPYFEVAVVLAVIDGGGQEGGGQRGVLVNRVDTQSANLCGVFFVGGDRDHADDLILDVRGPEVVAWVFKVSRLDVVKVGSGVVGGDLSREQPIGVEPLNVALIRGLVGSNGWGLG